MSELNTQRFVAPMVVDASGTVSDRRNLGLWLFVGLMLLMVGVGAYLLHPMSMPIKRVQVQLLGEQGALSPEVLREDILRRIQGGFFGSDLDEMRRQLLRKPAIRAVRLRRVWPDVLQLTVTGHRVVAYWGEDSLLNEEAEAFVPDSMLENMELPRLYGPVGTGKRLLEQFHALNHSLRGTGLRVSELTMNERRSWSLRLNSGITVNIGRMHFQQRLQRFIALSRAGFFSRFGPGRRIDLRYPNGFAVSRSNNV